MSFKRQGDDKNLLDNLRRRRINELLGEDIPEDEAKLLCNGRFACLVCGHNPVFDTVNMLRVHRQGKKHAANDAVFVRKKKELQALIARRKHEQYLKDGTTNIKQAAATSSGGGIVSSQPYDPSSKKRKLKPYDRKARLDLCSATALSMSQSAAVPTKHSHQLKNIFRPVQTRDFPLTPYVRQHATHTHTQSASSYLHHGSHNQSSGSQSSPQTPTDPQPLPLTMTSLPSSSLSWQSSSHTSADNVRQSLGSSWPSSSHSSSGESSAVSFRHNSGPSPTCSFGQSVITQSSSQNSSSRSTCIGQSGSGFTSDKSVGNHTHSSEAGGHGVQSGADGGVGDMSPHCGGVGSRVEHALPADPERKKLAQRYYQISGSGWKKDWDGKWIRDEEAEFDSDEEPPDLP